MKRFGIGLLWFIWFWLIGLLEGGIVLGVVLLIAAVAGTVTGFLPGTGKRPPTDAGQPPGSSLPLERTGEGS